VQRDVYLRLGPVRRLQLAFEMSEQARALAVAGIRARARELSEDDAKQIMLRRLLGDELFDRAWPARNTGCSSH
jgi:hypothetical protein